jgi:hypothetical protein
MAWLQGCEVCSAGLVAEMDDQIAKGYSQRGAAGVLEEQQKEKLGYVVYSGESILQRYRYHSGKKGACQIDTQETGKVIPLKPDQIDPQLVLVRKTLNTMLKKLQKIPVVADREKMGMGEAGVKLENAKRGFYRTIDQYPGEPTEEQRYVWETYFLMRKVAELAGLWGPVCNYLRRQLPEELPEHRSKPRKKKQASG